YRGSFSSPSRRSTFTEPVAAKWPLSSYLKPFFSAYAFKSRLEGQISKAIRPCSDSIDILEMPPRLRQKSYSLKRYLSPIATSGAPCPPSITSSERKSVLTGYPEVV